MCSRSVAFRNSLHIFVVHPLKVLEFLYSTECEVDYFHLVAFFPAEVSVAPKSKVKAEIDYQALYFIRNSDPSAGVNGKLQP
jgi:hypothetical protein